jgi:hypothetical protein
MCCYDKILVNVAAYVISVEVCVCVCVCMCVCVCVCARLCGWVLQSKQKPVYNKKKY